MASITETVATLPPERRRLLEQLLRREGVELQQALIVPQPHDGRPLPVSYAQRRLWFLDQLEPGSPLYNIPAAVRLRGRLDVPTLQRSLAAIVRRHETLRTTFVSVDGEPQQLIADEASAPLTVVDLRQHTGDQAARVHQLAAEEARRPFDLARGPLVRATLLRLADDDQIMLLSMHHIVSDGWSMGVLVRELGSLYSAHTLGQPDPLPPLPIQYADYARWQRDWLRGEMLRRQLEYWKDRLAGAPELLPLPTDRPRPASQTYRGAHHTWALPADLVARVAALAQQEGATLFMALLAAFSALLARASGQGDVCVGSPVAGRTRAELEGLIGCFVNTLVLRTDLSGEPGFRSLLRQVRDTTLAALASQDVPFELLVEELRPTRSMSYAPLFQVMFVLQNAPQGESLLRDLRMVPVEQPHGSVAKFDLTLNIAADGDQLAADLEYNTDLFDAATARRLAEQLGTLLAAAVEAPDTSVWRLPLIGAEERRTILEAWNSTATPFTRDRCAHELFAQQAARAPDFPALIFDDLVLSYAELDARANQLAHVLRRCGVGAEQIVGIYADRLPEMYVAILGTMKAGGAYLPLDPSYPVERLRFMLADARPSVILRAAPADQQHLGRGTASDAGWIDEAAGDDATVIDLLSEWDSIAREPTAPPACDASPESLAYVIYTSGSTGRPKGTLLHHRGLVNLAEAYIRAFDISTESRVLQFFSFGFDGSVADIFYALLSGAALCPVPRATMPDPDALADLIRTREVTLAMLPPSVLALLPEDALPTLQTVISGGEAATRDLARRWSAGRRYVNAYGPTEATVAASFYEVTEPAEVGAVVPIGRPLQNYRLYVLDRHMQPQPIGVPGELYIGGVGVARGYLNRPELTAERFVADPFAPPDGEGGARGGARLYRTGDLARWRASGVVEFLGRLDDQVKIRGFRIELGEIESLLVEHPEIQEAAVLAREDRPGDRRLVAYVVATAGAAGEELVARLRAFLRERLPEYMIPTAFVPLPQLPKTPNDKVDRRSLPAPAADEARLSLQPRTATEAALAALWSEVLGLAQVGVDDNFFDLGGHSLLATQLVARIRQTLGAEIPLRAVFEAPALAELAARVEAAQRSGGARQLPPITPAPRDAPLPLSFAQQRLWFLDQLEPGSPTYNIPEALRLSGPLDAEALHRGLAALVQRHETLRTTFGSVDGRAVQVVAPWLAPELPTLDLGALDDEARAAELRRVADAEARRPFDLERGPLLRAQLLRLAEQEHVLLLTMHHIIGDGWSGAVLTRELTRLYDAFTRGLADPLPPLPIQYADYAVWQRAWLEQPDEQGTTPLRRQLEYWQSQLRGAPAMLALPTDHPYPAAPTFRGGHLACAVPQPVAARLAEIARQEGATTFMVLLAAFQSLLYRYSGQEDFCVGTPIAGRTRPELEPLIGCFINTLVLRADLAGAPTFRELLRRTRATTLDAYAHQDAPFELVVDAVQPARNLSGTPLFQVMFMLQHMPLAASATPSGLTVQSVPADTGASTFDLTLALTETPDGLAGGFEYRADLFEAATIARVAGHFTTLLAAIAADADTPVWRLPLLDDAERHALLAVWSGAGVGSAEHLRHLTVHALVEARAAETPHAVAALYEGRQLSYGELNARANQLAHHLRRRGVGPSALVGLCVDRSLDMLVAVLGVLKAGAAYLPLDPSYPAERLRQMIDDSHPALVIFRAPGDAALADELAQLVGQGSLLRLIDEWPVIAREPDVNCAGGATADDLAYLIYTSGSTGRPKGVMVAHRSLVSAYAAWEEAYDLRGAVRRHLQLASLSFDVFAGDLLRALGSGGTLVICPRDLLLDPPALATLIRAERIDGAEFVPAVLRALGQHLLASGERLDPLRLIVCGSDTWYMHDYHRIRQVCAPGTRLINSFGLTETTIDSTYFEHSALPLRDDETVPIGRPYAGTQTYILDAHLQPVPIGVAGELYIGGAGVALGYANQPALTAERFISCGLGRLYRTGDRARYLADGNIALLGRDDRQVKIRGYRIEPGEVEATLMQHPAVQECAVVGRQDAAGTPQLLGYIVPRNAASGASLATELRAYLRGRLPEYMVPTLFVTLAALPLTPNGKVDRAALPTPTAEDAPAVDTTAPRTAAEETLAAIWADLLRLPRVGVHDSFFALGGDSILVIQVIARARQAGLHLTPRLFFQSPTVAELAAVATSATPIAAEQGMVVGSAPLTPIQRWFFEHHIPNRSHWNQSVLLEVRRPLERIALEAAVAALLEHHDALRMRFVPAAEGWAQTNAEHRRDDAADVLRWVDLRAVPDDGQVAAIMAAAAELQRSLDIERGPVARVAYLDLGSARAGRLLIVVHHLVVDGVSWRIVLEDLQVAYEQAVTGRAVTLPPKSSAFRDWARRLAAHAESDELRAELPFWLALAQARPTPLPIDLPGGANTEASAARLTVGLDEAETRALLSEVPGAYHSQINDVLLTALARAFVRWSGAPELLISLEGHGREDLFADIDLSRTVGWFTAEYPLLLRDDGIQRLGEAVRAVRDTLRQIPRRGIGYGLLHAASDPAIADRLRALPAPAVSFNYLGQFDQLADDVALLRPAPEPSGPDRDPLALRSQLIEVDGGVSEGRLSMQWTYSAAVHRRETIERVASEFIVVLRAIIAGRDQPESVAYTTGDFELAQVDQKTLDRLVERFSRKRGKA